MNNTVSPSDAILAACFPLLSQNPGASMADIAKAAGIGRATLHRHFASRDALVVALCRAAMTEIDAAIDAATANATSHTEALRLSIDALIPLAHRMTFLGYMTSDDPDLAAEYSRSDAEMHATIDAAKAEGTFDPHIPTPWINATCEALVYAAWEMVLAEEATPNQAAAFVWRTLTKGLAP